MTCKCGHTFADHCGPSRAVECSVIGCACQGFDEPDDPELAALREGVRLLQRLDADARERVLSYLRRRFIDEADT